MPKGNGYGRLTEKRPLTTNRQPGAGFPGSRNDGGPAKPKHGIGRNPKQRSSGPMKSDPFPPNKDRY